MKALLSLSVPRRPSARYVCVITTGCLAPRVATTDRLGPVCQVRISGPSGTPYAFGLFEFDVFVTHE